MADAERVGEAEAEHEAGEDRATEAREEDKEEA